MQKKINIGIFEGNEIDRYIYDRIFSKLEKDVAFTIFRSIGEGLEIVSKKHFDVLLIDYHYHANRYGIEILKQVQKITAYTFISVAVTPMLQSDDAEIIINSGFTCFMEMPVLTEKINDLLFPADMERTGCKNR